MPSPVLNVTGQLEEILVVPLSRLPDYDPKDPARLVSSVRDCADRLNVVLKDLWGDDYRVVNRIVGKLRQFTSVSLAYSLSEWTGRLKAVAVDALRISPTSPEQAARAFVEGAEKFLDFFPPKTGGAGGLALLLIAGVAILFPAMRA